MDNSKPLPSKGEVAAKHGLKRLAVVHMAMADYCELQK
ncbi:MAG: hypothetical protein H6Q73_2665 [Firmicutes bacterium]|nr:hypothetical protein [Bacillota bacterium]